MGTRDNRYEEIGKLNENSTAIGVGAEKELILFYLANRLGISMLLIYIAQKTGRILRQQIFQKIQSNILHFHIIRALYQY
jgi:hypothetical protein